VAGQLPAAARFAAVRAQLSLIKYDAINDRVVYSRQELQRIWSESLGNLRQFKLWAIRPFRLSRAMARDFFLTTSFANTFRSFQTRHALS